MNRFCRVKHLLLIGIALLSCTIKYSPHAQNEIFTPVTNEKNNGEAGAGFAINQWVHKNETNTSYIPSYPGISASLFYRQFQKQGIFCGFGCLEGILPVEWDEVLEGGFLFWLRMHIGGQFELPYFTLRLSFIPDFWLSIIEGKLAAGIGMNYLDVYQLTGLFHNPPKSNPGLWFGLRNSSSALGLVAGSEYSIEEDDCVRIEYSFLKRAPYSFTLAEDDLNSIEGSVHYFTLGVFRKF